MALERFVPWLKTAFVLFCLTLCLVFAKLVIATCAVYNVDTDWDSIRAAYHMAYLAELFQALSAAAVMMIARYSALFLAFVIAALAITFYGLLIDLHVNHSDRVGTVDRFGTGPERAETINDLITATAIILFSASLVITGLSLYTWIRSKVSPLKTVSTLYIIASLLNLLSSTWNFAYSVNWLLMPEGSTNHYVLILTIILAWWSRGGLLVIGYTIAARSGPNGGVWSGTQRKGGSLHDSVRYEGGTDYRPSYSTY
ncbi:hypothetical protein MFIFM68171_07137 [Madurella fahalii]|uniref:Uncharacterized protein n=1 Tax=Madurella fahalii TaxID=1157608 RepID=A0ABQ0GGN2_9PEZI